MKKYTSIICTMAVLLMASAVTFVSCSKDEEPTVSGKFTLTVNASKGAPATKDLRLDDEHNALTASWKQGEKVYVHNNTTGKDLSGYLEAQSNGVNTVLKGSLTGDIAVGNKLSLRFCSSDNYTSQQGTIEWIAENCDLATATVEVTDISTPSVTTSDAEFKNQQAIVKFSLRNAGNTDDLSATQLVVNVGGTDYTITPAEDTNVFYVALPGFSGESVTLSATVGGDTYTKTVSNITFVNGQYYTVTVGMKAPCSYTAPTAKSGVKAGQNDAIVNAGTAEGGTMMYKVTTANTKPTSTEGFSATVPTSKTLAAGTYYVWYYVKADDSHTDSEISATAIAVTIAPAKAAANATAEDKGKVIGTDGKIYADVEAATAHGTTAVAMIAYVGSETGVAGYTHGLALALSDKGQMNWSTAAGASGAAAHTPAAPTPTTSSWMLPSQDQWNKMIDACKNVLGTQNNYRDLRDGFSSVGGSNLQSASYWSSTEVEDDATNRAWRYDFSNGNWGGTWIRGIKGFTDLWVRACLAF